MRYRPDVDGLRAVAVMLVVGYHAGLPLIPGGYVGVDVFFVISGYLICAKVIGDLRSGNFSLLGFYDGRARRILPALFVVLFCVCLAGWLWMGPAEMTDLSRSVIATLAFYQNIQLWQDSGYFSIASELKPLLHTWSLSVEEQFYFFFPLAAMLLWSKGLRVVFSVFLILSLASLLASEWTAGRDAGANFYLLPTRAWELLVGVLVALIPSTFKPPRIVREIGAALGLGAIVWSAFYLNGQTAFPGFWALLPTLGAALIILLSDQYSFAGRLLSLPPVVGVGLISYSAYLWHQPLFAFARIYALDPPGPEVFAGLSALTLFLAYLTWRYVEKPFRNKVYIGRRMVFALAGLIGAAFITFGIFGVSGGGFASRQQLPETVVASISWSERSKPCGDIPMAHNGADRWFCDVNEPAGPPSFFVFGDSHTMAFFDAIEAYANSSGRHGEVTAFSGCVPLLGAHALRNDQDERNCFAMNQRIFEHIKASGMKDLVLIARWTYYTDGGYSGSDFSFISDSPDGPATKDESRATFRKALAETVAAYSAIGVTVHMVMQAPQQRYDPEKLYRQAFLNSRLGVSSMKSFLEDRSVLRSTNRELQRFVKESVAAYDTPFLKIVDLEDLFCDEKTCAIGSPAESFYYDDDHLSQAGARRAALVLIDQL